MTARRNKNFSILLLVIVAIGVAVLLLSSSMKSTKAPTKDSSGQTTAEKQKIYQSQKYNFSFSYPNDLSVVERSTDFISVVRKIANTSDQIANIYLISASPDIEAAYEEFILDSARLLCVDSNKPDQACTEVKNLAEFKTDSGISGTKFNLILESGSGALTTKTLIGPYIAFNMSLQTSAMSTLLFTPGHTLDTSSETNSTIVSLAKSFKLK